MEKIQNILNNRLGRGLLAGGLVLGLMGCSNTSSSGNSDEFIVRGQVTNAGHQSLKARVYEINETHDASNGWFDIGHQHRIHDNCDCHGFWSSHKRYGTVYNQAGDEIEPQDVAVGACVVFIGAIRNQPVGKTTEDRPVFETAKLVPCPLDNPIVEMR